MKYNLFFFFRDLKDQEEIKVIWEIMENEVRKVIVVSLVCRVFQDLR